MADYYTWPTCESCDRRTDEVVETYSGVVLCEECFEGQKQADADRAYNYARDREMWEANDG